MFIQINLPDDINKQVSIKKVELGVKTKQETILKILQDYFEVTNVK